MESVGGTRNLLPLRKRKFAVAEILQNKRHSTDNQETGPVCIVEPTSSCNNVAVNGLNSSNLGIVSCSPTTSSKKRRRVTSGSSTSGDKEAVSIIIDLKFNTLPGGM